ncbi:UbiA family prenyltransferase [Tenacibaculum salmonis]|uniref:UbiA family prenyltransferase n=1 Tax=Tenacibaculum sp. P3-BQ1 TaxID=3232310 RepID=UPI0034DF06EA
MLLYLGFVFFLFKYSFLYGYGFKTILSFFDLAILTIAILLFISSNYLVVFYSEKQQSITNNFFLPYAKKYAIIFGILGLLLSTFLSFKIQKPIYSLLFIICFPIILIYSKKIVGKTFMSNILRPFLRSFLILFVCWFDSPVDITSSSDLDLFIKIQVIISLYVITSFLANIIQEIIIDIKNVNHDNKNNNKTLPILLGRNRAKKTAIIISTIICFIYFSITFLYVNNISIRYLVIFFGTVPNLVFIYYLMNASSSDDYKTLSKIFKIVFFIAFITIPIISYYLKHVIK